MAIATVNPTTGRTVRQFASFTRTEIEERLSRAASAFSRWRSTPIAERARVVARAGEILNRDRETYGRLMTVEMGKLLRAGIEEAQKCALGCRHYAENAERFLAEEVLEEPGGVRERILYQPLGVVLAVMPWNFPFWQVIRFAAPALVAGNVALLKHASNVPQCALALEELFRRAGAPDGVFQTLLVGAEAVPELIADQRVVAVTLTGSDRAGAAVATAAGKHLKKAVLELGGSDPFLVLPSADLDQAVDMAMRARTINNGQSCIAAKRFIVAEEVYDAFTSRFTASMAALKVGDPLEPTTEIGPLATAAIREGLADQVERSVQAGARVLTGARFLPGEGFFYAPTVLTDVPPGSPAAEEELFGPVAAVFRAHDLEDALRLANDSPFGLGASVWTRDPIEAERCVHEVQAGTVFVNGVVASDPRFPFGGIKRSGYGRELGVVGMREFVNIKRVRMAPAGRVQAASKAE
jgi:succinate-semialdehyde dehydrogenase / glutarate-semialdehyde dehydrogenase